MPDTGFIILNYNTYERTARNVDIFIEHNKSVFVIVVDNLSPNDDYDKLVQHYATREQIMVVQSGENGGYSKGNNFGIRKMLERYPDIKYIGIMNPDVRCEEDGMVEKLIGIMNGGGTRTWYLLPRSCSSIIT